MKELIILTLMLLVSCEDSVSKGDLIVHDENIVSHSTSLAVSDSYDETATWPESFGFGEKATREDITRLDISIAPDGRGLPKGEGRSLEGAIIYQNKCFACHGNSSQKGQYDVLFSNDHTQKTIRSHWPYATTLYDYIRRTMPFNQPGSLTDEEVYHLTAYILKENKIIDAEFKVNAETLPNIVMPARELFVPDDRKGGPEIR